MTLLTIENLRKSFGGLKAVDGLSFSVQQGEVLGLLGPNGSGKTTAMNLVSGALKADSGSVRLGSHELVGLPSYKIARLGVARTFQLVRVLGGMTCSENVQAGMAFRAEPSFGSDAAREALQLLELVGLRHAADIPAGDMTYIDQKRLELARALALQPKLLLLDEWLAGLNPTELQVGIELIRQLRAQGLTVILIEHVMDAVRSLCDRCVVMFAGAKLAEGETSQVLSQEEVITAYLGAPHA
ncbi:MAG TPA: ABC transporter ATP-binding protein [Pusillimonas sp.]|uniref:ABC transporter ATP-binding protein n=1 Tax=unclassified Pusillimonas TaxID=2640016 RepID=UPI002633C63E|nr:MULTISPECIES: ABC transporter ATP-binding protein [unclassified Pusillimonas]HLU19925.1 ABC transporter ATP-binding protein [Pusillimonas sp.]